MTEIMGIIWIWSMLGHTVKTSQKKRRERLKKKSILNRQLDKIMKDTLWYQVLKINRPAISIGDGGETNEKEWMIW